MLLVVRNERQHIERCLNSILGQTYPKDKLELLLIDGMSHDGTFEYLQSTSSVLKESGWNIQVLRNLKMTLATGWNIGIRAAKCGLVCRIDGHSELDSNYVEEGVRALVGQPEEVVAVGGWLTNQCEGSLAQRAISYLLASPFGVGNSPFRRQPDRLMVTDTAVYAIYRRALMIEAGLFDESLMRNQDLDLHDRLHSSGFQFMTHPAMKVTYHVRNSIKKLLGKALKDGEWVIRSRGWRLRHLTPLFFVGYLVVFAILIIIGIPSLWFRLMAIPSLLYMGLDVFFSAKASSGTRLALLIIFPMFHISYGIGTLSSLIYRIVNRLRS